MYVKTAVSRKRKTKAVFEFSITLLSISTILGLISLLGFVFLHLDSSLVLLVISAILIIPSTIGLIVWTVMDD